MGSGSLLQCGEVGTEKFVQQDHYWQSAQARRPTNLKKLRRYLKEVFFEGWSVALTIAGTAGLVLLVLPKLSDTPSDRENIAQIVGGFVLVAVLLGAPYRVCRRNTSNQEPDPDLLILSHHSRPQLNPVCMYYAGTHSIDQIRVEIQYEDADGQAVAKQIDQFYPENDKRMAIASFSYEALSPNERVYFHTVRKKTAPTGKVKVVASCRGVKSHKTIRKERDFDLAW